MKDKIEMKISNDENGKQVVDIDKEFSNTGFEMILEHIEDSKLGNHSMNVLITMEGEVYAGTLHYLQKAW